MIKPGANAENIVNTSTNEIQNLGTHDTIILNAGTNDVDRNNKVPIS